MSHVFRSLAAAALAAIAMLASAGVAAAGASLIVADSSLTIAQTGYVPPQFKNQVKPQYPDSARAAGETGEVKVKVLVQPNGTPKNFTIFKSSGHKDLDDAVLAALKASSYKPAISDGKPTLAFLDVTYKYTLQGLAETAGNATQLEQALAANPKDAHTRVLLATGDINRAEYAKAESVLADGTKLDPSNAKFWSLLGFAYYMDGTKNKNDDRFKQAADSFDKALAAGGGSDSDTNRDAALAYGRYAFALLESQQPAAALPYAQKAAKLAPTEVQYQIELGEALQGTGDNQGALAMIPRPSDGIRKWLTRSDRCQYGSCARNSRPHRPSRRACVCDHARSPRGTGLPDRRMAVPRIVFARVDCRHSSYCLWICRLSCGGHDHGVESAVLDAPHRRAADVAGEHHGRSGLYSGQHQARTQASDAGRSEDLGFRAFVCKRRSWRYDPVWIGARLGGI